LFKAASDFQGRLFIFIPADEDSGQMEGNRRPPGGRGPAGRQPENASAGRWGRALPAKAKALDSRSAAGPSYGCLNGFYI